MVAGRRISLALFLLLLSGNIHLFSQDGLKLSIIPGFSGSFSAGYWIPLTIIIESEIPPFEGFLEVSLPLGSILRADRAAYTIKKKISIEPGVARRVILTVPLQRREELTVRIKNENKTIKEGNFTLTPFGYRGKTILLLSRRADLGIQAGTRWLSLSAHPETLPVSPEGYSSISAVILHNALLNETSPQQIEALITWVRDGGLLIVTGGIVNPGMLPATLTDVFPYFLHGRGKSAQPPPIAGSDTHPLPVMNYYQIWLGELKDDAVPIVKPGPKDYSSFPMEAVRKEGRGMVAATLIDPAAAPYKSWDGLADYWSLLLSLQPSGGKYYPLTDPLPDLHAQLMSKMPDSSKPLPLQGGWFLTPFLLLLIPALLKRPVRGWLISAALLPILIALSMVFLLPSEKTVYREISLVKGSFNDRNGDLWLKPGITSRRGGIFPLSLPDEYSVVLPNSNESLSVSGNPDEVYLARDRWEPREFFISTSSGIPVNSDVRRSGTDISGHLNWGAADDFKNAILIGGEYTAEKVVLLFEPGGLSFRAMLSHNADALEKEAEYIKESSEGFTSAQRAYMDYLISNGLLPRENGSDFYFLLFNGQGNTFLNPPETENISLEAVLLDFNLEEIPDEE